MFLLSLLSVIGDSMTLDPKTLVPATLIQPIFDRAKSCLFASSLPEHRQHIEQQQCTVSQKSYPLGKLLSKFLAAFRTQDAGGFEIAHPVSQERVEETLLQQITKIGGVTYGIETSEESLLPLHPQTHLKEVGVYNASATIGLQQVISLSTANQQSIQELKVHGVSSPDHPKVWIGHTSSGTSEVEKAPVNRDLLYRWLKSETFNTERDVFFGDVNFDLTDSVSATLGMDSTIQMLVDWSKELGVQFVFPMVRVRKKRYADRPFANNQIHKCEEQIAESMVTVLPESMKVKAVDQDGLVCIRQGEIRLLQPNQPTTMCTPTEIPWKHHNSFSRAVTLDHKPILLFIDGIPYQFYNFMDFKGDRGIKGTFWYQSDQLREQEQIFVDYLIDLLG